jgi:hypothetical protein
MCGYNIWRYIKVHDSIIFLQFSLKLVLLTSACGQRVLTEIQRTNGFLDVDSMREQGGCCLYVQLRTPDGFSDHCNQLAY